MAYQIELEEDLDVLIQDVITRSLVLYNDDVNTFDHVIDCLMAICEHEETQATQCAFIVHYNGKCNVKNGSYEKLKPMYEALLEAKLSVKIH